MSVDFVQAANGGTLSESHSGAGTSGTLENVRDGNTSTSFYAGGASGGSVIVRSTFSRSVTLTSVYVKAKGSGSNPGSSNVSAKLYGASDNLIATLVDTTTPNGSTAVDQTYNGTWQNVKYMVVSSGGGGISGGGCYVYEMKAFGTIPFVDIGLRVRVGSVTKTIACETLNGHQVRIRKGSTTYGIPVVNTSDSNASPFRIRIGSTTKALRYYS